jgi:hypothetical protein
MALTNQQKLDQAREAYHLLRTGQQRVQVRYGERSVTYTAANRADLAAYIAELEELTGDFSLTKRGEPFSVQWS